MAQVNQTIAAKVKASTLIEVLISMVIIVVIFSIAMAIYGNVLRLNLTVQKYKAQVTLNQMAQGLNSTERIYNDDFNLGDIRVDKKVSLYKNNRKLKEIQLKAYSNNHELLAEVRKVIYVP